MLSFAMPVWTTDLFSSWLSAYPQSFVLGRVRFWSLDWCGKVVSKISSRQDSRFHWLLREGWSLLSNRLLFMGREGCKWYNYQFVLSRQYSDQIAERNQFICPDRACSVFPVIWRGLDFCRLFLPLSSFCVYLSFCFSGGGFFRSI